MKDIICKYLVFGFAISPVMAISAQMKYEKEYGIKAHEAPESARHFIQRLNLNEKIKWYKEIGIDQVSYEAKVKHQSSKYSIEFDVEGMIQDVEVVLKGRELDTQIAAIINDYFSSNFDKYKICKIQRQLLGDEETLISAIMNADAGKNITINYEIVSKVRENNKWYEVECLFDSKGELLRKDRIVQRNTDNLEY